ncbi:O-methyltransferase [Nocardia transvalensis]|uniref:O-methyltransferase n=1 Tax=Nocardia transvalensis TaxID=37333 RepID=UPI0018961CC0|nr:class I SAM-dependent methyltransferase [Nocardia transvalensis]MBF6331276.1 class I SAM-dependent methyltransferase [Nocardia transvalensis]
MSGTGISAKLRDRVPFARWSWVRLGLGLPTFQRTGQVGDGREAVLRDHVLAHATAGDPDDVLATIDDFARNRCMLVTIGDEKGLILDAAVRSAQPRLLLELGTYCGYSAVRMGRLLRPGARLVSVEFSAANAEIARSILDHAGLGKQVNVVVGRIGDGGATLRRLAIDHGFGFGALDFVFLDHMKTSYLPDLRTLLAAGWLHPGTVVVADNMRLPGAPDYLRYMRENEGHSWHTTDHPAHVEYQSLLKDLVLESQYLG